MSDPPLHSLEDDLKRLLDSIGIPANIFALPVRAISNRPATLGVHQIRWPQALLALLTLYLIASITDGPTVSLPYSLWATLVVLFFFILHRAWLHDRAAAGEAVAPNARGRSWLPGPASVIKAAVEPLLAIGLALLLSRFSRGLCLFWLLAALSHGMLECMALVAETNRHRDDKSSPPPP